MNDVDFQNGSVHTIELTPKIPKKRTYDDLTERALALECEASLSTIKVNKLKCEVLQLKKQILMKKLNMQQSEM